jgi:PIN domain nuclease of toxin-antitoxin system
VIVNADLANLHKVHQEGFRRLLVHIAYDEAVRLYKRDQLLLLVQNVLKVVQVRLWLVLVHELFN